MSQLELLYAKAKNFLSYKEVSLDLNQGMCLIEGWNHDENSSNGAGKTAALDILSFGIFDEVPRDLKIDEIINEQEGKDCQTEVGFKLNGSTYQIFKTRKPNDAYIIKDGVELPRGKDLKETREMIQKLIKLDYQTFINSIYLSQGGKSEFIALTDVEKQKILTEVLDLSIFDDGYKIASQQIKELDQGFSKIQAEIGHLQGKAVEINAEIAQLQVRSNGFEHEKKKVITQKNAELITISGEIDIIKTQIEYHRVHSTFADVKPLDITQEMKQIEDLKQKLQLQDQVNTLLNQASQNIFALNSEIQTLNTKKQKFLSKKEGDCSECGQTVTGAHLKQEVDKFNILVLEKSNNKVQHEEQYNQYKVVQDKLKDLQQQKQTLESQIYQMQMQHQSELFAIDQKKMSIKNEISKHEHSINYKIQQYQNLEKEVQYWSTKTNEYDQIIAEKQVKFEQCSIEIKQKQEYLNTIEVAMRKYSVLKDMYKNIKYFVFSNMVERLNSNIKSYLDTLFNCSIQVELNTETTNTKGEIKQKFQTEIYKNGQKRSYNSLSGGEKQRVKLATSFAFADVLSTRSTNSFNILFLDEILGEGLDSEGAAKVVDLLEQIKKEKNIFIIDHHEYVKVLVDKVIKVEKKDGISTLLQ